MKQFFFVFILALAVGLLPGSGFAEQKHSVQQPAAFDGPYNSSVRYAGSYKNELLFFRYADDGWQRKPRLDRLRSIKCKDALESLSLNGTWIGTFKVDGSCGGSGALGEHPEWATGNRLNYDEQLMTQGQQPQQ